MPYGLYMAAAGADVQSERLKILSHNLANVDTPGFKREFAVMKAVAAEAIEQGDALAGSGGIDDIGGGVELLETVTDFAKGIFKQTGIPTDMAIEGDGFFVVANGEQELLTRSGNFQIASTGQLQTDQGHAVLAAEGTPINLDPSLPWRLRDDGHITQAGNDIPLAIVQPTSLGDLVKTGQNLFSALGNVAPVAAGERQVLGGYLEQSTVKPALEMMELIETSRAYEANVRMIQNQDQMIGTLVNRVLGQS